MKTKIFTLALVFILGFFKSQVIITPKNGPAIVQDQSAVLKIADPNRGVLLPRVLLQNTTDQITVPTPVQGLLLYNSTTNKMNFWEANKWNRNFDIADALALIKVTQNFSGASTGSKTNSSFPTSMPLFNLNDSTTGWEDLGASTTITITKTTNTNYIITEGMVMINNDVSTAQEFQFAIGVFVDGQLKLVRKYTEKGKNYICTWKKFNLAGIFDNLSVGIHTIQIYGRNLPKITTGFTSITYGGNSSNCNNINNDMARVFVTAQVTE